MSSASGAPALGRSASRADGLHRLDTANLRERAREAIRASIVSGGLAPDEVYSVASLAARLGVSATPIREALFDLSSEGLVEVLPKRGLRVPRLSDHDLDEITALRLMLEVPPITRLASRGLDDDTAGQLRELAARTEVEAREGDVVTFLTIDKAFHMALLELDGNRRLLQLVGRLRDETRLYGLDGLRASGELAPSAAEHAEILQAIEDRDCDETAQLVKRHLWHTRGLWAGRTDMNP